MHKFLSKKLLFAVEAAPTVNTKSATITAVDNGGCSEGARRMKMQLSEGPFKRIFKSIMQPKVGLLFRGARDHYPILISQFSRASVGW